MKTAAIRKWLQWLMMAGIVAAWGMGAFGEYAASGSAAVPSGGPAHAPDGPSSAAGKPPPIPGGPSTTLGGPSTTLGGSSTTPGSPPSAPAGSAALSGSRVEIPLAYYRLGDSPVDGQGAMEWTKPDAAEGWSRMPMTGSREANLSYAWFSLQVPSELDGKRVRDPHLLLSDARYDFEVFSGTERIYRYGDLQDERTASRAGQPVMVPLDRLDPRQPIYIRIHSELDSVLAGRIGPVMYGNQTDLRMSLLRSDIPNAIGAFVFFIVGLVSIMMYFLNRGHRANLVFALFSLLLALNVAMSLRFPMLFADMSLLRTYGQDPLAGILIYLFASYFVMTMRPAYAVWIRRAGLAVMCAAWLMPVARWAASDALDRYSGFLSAVRSFGFSALCAACFLTMVVGCRRRQASGDAKWLIGGFSIYLLMNAIGIPLRYWIERKHGFIVEEPIRFVQMLNVGLDYALLFSTAFFAIISFRRYQEIYREMHDNNLRIAGWNRALEQRVQERTRALQNLLDYAGQGFLSFDKRLLVQAEHSLECSRLFRRSIADARYTELMYPDNPAEQMLNEDILQQVFQEDDLQREVCLSLLPTSAEINGRYVELQYRWLPGDEEGKVMVILTDRTDQRQLERQMETERSILHTVVWVIRHYRDFREMIDEYRSFVTQDMPELLGKEMADAEKCAELLRAVHTFKGNFAQIEFLHTSDKLHELETRLEQWQRQLHAADALADPVEGGGLRIGTAELLQCVSRDIGVLRDILGEHFDRNDETVTIELERLQRLEEQVYMMLPSPEAALIAGELNKLRYRPFRELLDVYPDYTVKLAERLGKIIYPITIVGGDMLVNPDVYRGFVRTLIHMFRNMVEHGIEKPEERAAKGKDRRGMIRCVIAARGQAIELTLANDGSEIDLAALRERVLAMELYPPRVFDSMFRQQQMMCIFHEGFSTKTTISKLSGRGVGLSAVRKSAAELGGTIRIESAPEAGTKFIVQLPLRVP
ncbi:ATP-binding protein [Cohnella fermenti]|uniref:histidine kinase n=1 Tax=Cohnella fermenti TaxID=2565925 RepID=A0A4S4BQD4_9BACL|nr:ATP-binding protein [Cohnella fermenti]THF77147.1 hypothetical protein E6C55_17450 [Cohnella fermenti]